MVCYSIQTLVLLVAPDSAICWFSSCVGYITATTLGPVCYKLDQYYRIVDWCILHYPPVNMVFPVDEMKRNKYVSIAHKYLYMHDGISIDY